MHIHIHTICNFLFYLIIDQGYLYTMAINILLQHGFYKFPNTVLNIFTINFTNPILMDIQVFPIIKAIYDKPTAKIILRSKIRKKIRMPITPTVIQQVLKVLARTTRLEEEIKGIQTEKK